MILSSMHGMLSDSAMLRNPIGACPKKRYRSMPVSQAAYNICGLHDLDFDALDSVDADDLADKIEQANSSSYMRSMAKAMPKDVTMVQKFTLKLRKSEHHEHDHRDDNERHHDRKPKHQERER